MSLKNALLNDVLEEAVNNNLLSKLIDRISVEEDKCQDVREYIRKLNHKLFKMEYNRLKREYHLEDKPVDDIEELKVGDKICIIQQFQYDTDDDLLAKIDFETINHIKMLNDKILRLEFDLADRHDETFPYRLGLVVFQFLYSHSSSMSKLDFSNKISSFGPKHKFVPIGLGPKLEPGPDKVEIYRIKN